MNSARKSKYTIGQQPPPINMCSMNEGELVEEVNCIDEAREQDSLEIQCPAYDLPSSICQDHNDSIVVEGMQEIQPSDQEMDGNAVETREKVKRGKENVDEEEYDEMKEIQEIAKKRKASKGRRNNLKKARIESLQKDEDEDVHEQSSEKKISDTPKKKYNTLWYSQSVDILDTPRSTPGNDRRRQQSQPQRRSLRNKQSKEQGNTNS